MLSIVVPMHNEVGNVGPLVSEIEEACAGLGSFEAVLVDDGSTDGTGAAIQIEMTSRPWLRMLRHPSAGGQSAAVHSGVRAAAGQIICTLDGDLQNPPAEIPNLVAPFSDPGSVETLGLVAGQRVGRRDTWSKRAASRAANAIRAWMLNDATRDTGCGLKAFRREAFLELPYFDHMHRYLPALFVRAGYTVVHVDVSHRERAAGRSKYSNFQRAVVGVYDLIGVAWLIRRGKGVRPEEVARGADEESAA
ncbi:MAG: glycosyltransferase family 2 protein [Pseudomonadota bacterium]